MDIAELLKGIGDVKSLVQGTQAELKTLGDRLGGVESGHKTMIESALAQMKTIEAEHAKMAQKFIEFQKRGAMMSPEQKTRRGLGNKAMNDAFGKAMQDLVRRNAYSQEIFTKTFDDTYTISVEYASEIIRLVEARGLIRAIAKHVPMGAGTMNMPRRTAALTAYHVAKNVAGTPAQPTVAQVQLVADKIQAICLVANESLEDTPGDLGAFIAEEIAHGLATVEDTDALNGDGTATYGYVKGLFNASLYLLPNKPTELAMGAGKTSVEDVTFDNLIELTGKVNASALPGARFVMNRTVADLVRSIKDDTKNYIWERSGAAGQPATLLGYPVSISDLAPARSASVAGLRFIAFGNFDYWYFGDRKQINMTADQSRYREYNQTGFFAVERVAQNIADGGAFAVLKTAGA